MKTLLFILFTACSLNLAAQNLAVNPDLPTSLGTLQFNTHYYDLWDHWVALPKKSATGKYTFGFVYFDMAAGYTLNVEGYFGVDGQGHIFRDSVDYIKNAMLKIRLAANTVLMAPLTDNMLAELKTKKVPFWLAGYEQGAPDVKSVAMEANLGKHLNGEGAPAKALEYLEDAYKTEPHADGLEFELTYSYNELKQYDKAIAILNSAIANAPNNSMFYRELGFAYMRGNNFDEATKWYKKGIAITKQTAGKTTALIVAERESRFEMTRNLVFIYVQQKKFDDAIAVVSDFITDSPRYAQLYNVLASIYFTEKDYDNAIKTYQKEIEIVTGAQAMETKAQLAWDIAVIYRDQKTDPQNYNLWGNKAKEWAPANSAIGKGLQKIVL